MRKTNNIFLMLLLAVIGAASIHAPTSWSSRILTTIKIHLWDYHYTV